MLLLVIFCAAISAVTSADIPEDTRIWCYYTNWAQYRPETMKYTVEDLDLSLCTHAAFAFAVLNDDNTIKSYEYNDEDSPWAPGMYSKFTNLKTQNPNLKTYLSVGGWNFGALPFSYMAGTQDNRTKFIESTIPFLRKYNFDGLDLDWEYPADVSRNGTSVDKENFVSLIKELYRTYELESKRTGKPRLQLAIAAPAPKKKVDAGMDIKRFIEYIDFVNVMTYDFHGAWEKNTGHSSPLFPLASETEEWRTWNVAYSVTYWHKLGAPKSKINVGLPFYGRTYTLADRTKTYLGAPATGAGKNGTVTRIAGFLSYFEACDMKNRGGKRFFIDEQKSPYMVLDDQWLGYEDVHSITIKVHWLREHGYTGMMIWTMDLDDYKGSCNQGKYPLTHAIIKALKDTADRPKNNDDDDDVHGGLKKFCFDKVRGFYPHCSNCQKFVYCDNFMEGIIGLCGDGKMWSGKACVLGTKCERQNLCFAESENL